MKNGAFSNAPLPMDCSLFRSGMAASDNAGQGFSWQSGS